MLLYNIYSLNLMDLYVHVLHKLMQSSQNSGNNNIIIMGIYIALKRWDWAGNEVNNGSNMKHYIACSMASTLQF